MGLRVAMTTNVNASVNIYCNTDSRLAAQLYEENRHEYEKQVRSMVERQWYGFKTDNTSCPTVQWSNGSMVERHGLETDNATYEGTVPSFLMVERHGLETGDISPRNPQTLENTFTSVSIGGNAVGKAINPESASNTVTSLSISGDVAGQANAIESTKSDTAPSLSKQYCTDTSLSTSGNVAGQAISSESAGNIGTSLTMSGAAADLILARESAKNDTAPSPSKCYCTDTSLSISGDVAGQANAPESAESDTVEINWV
jgi:hypothetical protein